MPAVFGTGAVQLRVMFPNTSNFVHIPLPSPNRRIPRVKPIVAVLEGDTGQIIDKRIGFRVSFVLEFEIDLNDTDGPANYALISKAFNAQGELRLIPYSDNSIQEFSVFMTEESELGGLIPNKSQYALCKLVYESRYPVQSWKTLDDWTILRRGAVYTIGGKTLYVFSGASRSSTTSSCIHVL